jgi:hypothetical protein
VSSTTKNSASTQSRHGDAAPWYRQFWPWFLIALPLASVVLGIATVSVAVRHADTVLSTTTAAADFRKGPGHEEPRR